MWSVVFMGLVGVVNSLYSYRCTLDEFDYYDTVDSAIVHRIWYPFPESIRTCSVPYYMAYCSDRPIHYSYRLPKISNHAHDILLPNVSGSYFFQPIHTMIHLEVLCIPTHMKPLRHRYFENYSKEQRATIELFNDQRFL